MLAHRGWVNFNITPPPFMESLIWSFNQKTFINQWRFGATERLKSFKSPWQQSFVINIYTTLNYLDFEQFSQAI